jgi:hypothetical protein
MYVNDVVPVPPVVPVVTFTCVVPAGVDESLGTPEVTLTSYPDRARPSGHPV